MLSLSQLRPGRGAWGGLSARANRAVAGGDCARALGGLGRAALLSEVNSQVMAMLGIVHVAAGESERARQVLTALEVRANAGYVPATSLASICNALGNRLGALDLLERAYAQRDIRMTFLKVDARWNNLRGEPRFQALSTRLRLELSQSHADGRL